MTSQNLKNSSFSKELALVHRDIIYNIYTIKFSEMSKVTDSDTESDSSDIESLLSYNDPSKLVPYSFESLATLNDEDSDSEGNVQQQSSSNN